MSTDIATSYWRAVANLRINRDDGLSALEECFASGKVPTALNGDCRGRLLAITSRRRRDRVFEALARVWMPWLGKTFDSAHSEGRNLFSSAGRKAARTRFRHYADFRYEGEGRYSAFRFVTSEGPSALNKDLDVLRIDYRALHDNPAQVREVLDELVEVDDGIYLGQALIDRRGEFHRAAWFSLEK